MSWWEDAAINVASFFVKTQNVVDFASDPLGGIYEGLRNAANGLTGEVLPAIFAATAPDLSVDWFVSAYALSFGLGIILWGFLLLAQFVAVARGKASPAAFLDALITNSGAYFAGVLFGPVLAMMLIQATKALTQSLVTWGLTDTAGEMFVELGAILNNEPGAIPGGVIVGILLLLGMVIGVLLVVLMQIVLLVTLYFSAVFVPVGLAWLVSSTHRRFGIKIPLVWLSLLMSQPLLIFVMGVAFKFIGSSLDTFVDGSDGFQVVVKLIAAAVALLLVGLAPAALMKFLPVDPGGANAEGPALSVPGGGGGGDRKFGPESLSDVKQDRHAEREVSESTAENRSSTSQDSETSSESQPGSLSKHLSKLQSRDGGSAGAADTASESSGASAGQGAGAGGGAGTAGSAGGTGAAGSTAGGGSAGAGAGAGATGPGTAGAGAAGASGSGAASAGGAKAAAAAGPVIGAVALGALAAKKGADMAQAGGAQAADAMDSVKTGPNTYRDE